jgi:hypothetical protein
MNWGDQFGVPAAYPRRRRPQNRLDLVAKREISHTGNQIYIKIQKHFK